MSGDLEELVRLGKMLEDKPELLAGKTVGLFLMESLLRVRAKDGAMYPLTANTAQLAFEERRGKWNIVLKARQMGMSTWVSGRFFLKTITQPGTLTVLVAHTQEAAEGIFRVVQRFWEHLPEELREGAARTSRSNARQIVFSALDSEFRVESAGDANVGRGLTIQNLHCSELSRWPGNAAETLRGLKAALSPEGELVMESTPNGAQGCFYEEWQAAEQAGVVRHFFPWWMESAYRSAAVREADLTEVERQLMQRYGLDQEQIAYRRTLQKQYRRMAVQEYAEDEESCFLASGDCVFDVEVLRNRLRILGEPISQRWNGQLQTWFPAVEGRKYLVAVDTAGGMSDGDYSAAQVIDIETGLQCAELQAKLGTLELAKAVAELGKEFNGALIAVERNNHGHGVLAYLDGVARYPRIYAQDGMAGWVTSAASKPMMVSRLGSVLVEQEGLFQSRRLLMECRTFVRRKDGKTGAASGSHDDCVMAMALAHAVRAEILEGGRRAGY